ncbi:MAG: GcrY protein [Corynebacterium casei]|nr:GcrY protein [Corynebacterium casei]
MVSSTPQLIDRAQIRRSLDDFTAFWLKRVGEWKETKETATEKKYAQQFWSDLFACFGVNAARMDLFEQDAQRSSTGGSGYIDLFWPGVVIGEAKSLGVSLDVAHVQARDYLAGGSVKDFEMPRYILCSNFESIRLSKLGDPDTRFDITFSLAELPAHIDQLRFLAGFEAVTKEEEEEASIQASKLMADLFTAMAGDDVDEAVGDEAPTNPEEEDHRTQQTSMYLTRLLFLLFGDDAGLWEQDLFYRFVLEETTSENLGPQLNSLFEVLNTPERRRQRLPEHLAKFPYVNGSIFADQMRTEYFDPEMRDALINACRFHWSHISPAVFGSMFQLVKSKEARRNDGEHYTSEKNILKVLDPLFLDELRAEAKRLISAKSTPVRKLRDFRDSLADMIFTDPACGAGNFLVVAYRELRKIETAVIVEIRRREGQSDMAIDVSWEQKLSIGQFYGFELNWWPAKLAETAMFLVDHQANRELAEAIGAAPERLPITITAHIIHGNALRLNWQATIPRVTGLTYVFGNPPFRGDGREREQLEDMKHVWGEDKQISRMDYVTSWHAKTLDMLAKRPGMFAFVTTNSIVQGDQTPRLFEPIFASGWRIRFAHRTFAWDSEAPGKAAVHCVIVGFDRQHEPRPQLWDYPKVDEEAVKIPVERSINAYLVDGPNVLVKKASKPISTEVAPSWRGSMPTDDGNLIVEAEDYQEVVSDPIAAKYVHRYLGAKELLEGTNRWCLWLDGMNPADLSRSALLRKRVEAVGEFRSKSKAKSTRDYAQFPHLFRQLAKQEVEYLCIPRHVSENRRYFTVARFSPDVIAGDANFTLPDPDGLQFGLMSSSMFITWQKTVGGRLESRLRFGSTLTWYTFPVPKLEEASRQRIIKAGQGVIAARELHPERSLAEHYSPLAMDRALVKAHDALDREVDKAFGAERKLSHERQRQELLFANYSRLSPQ